MSATVIDRLVVELGIDPKKYSAGTADAQARTEKFRKTIAGLGIDETKLDDKQKKGLESLRKVATQSQRTGKELQAAGTAGDEFWSVLKKGAIGFGAALGIVGLQRMMTDTIATNSALARTAPLLGMNAKALDTLNKAVREATGGTGAGVAGTMQGLSDSLQGLASGTIPEGLIQSLAMLSMRSGGPMTALRHPDGSALTPDELLKNIADEVQKVGPAAAHSILGPAGFDDETIQFMAAKGRPGVEAGLAAAAPNTLPVPDYASAQEASRELNKLADAIGKLRDILVLAAAPKLINEMTKLVVAAQYATGQITLKQFNDVSDKADADYLDANPENKVNDAFGKLQDINGTDSVKQKIGRFFNGASSGEWTEEQERTRLGQLIAQGKTPDYAAQRVSTEQSTHRSFDSVSEPTPTASGIDDNLMNSLKRVESGGNPNAVSPKGARGLYQMMPKTAHDYRADDPSESGNSLKAAKHYLSDLAAHYGGDVRKALAAYNWGRGNLDGDIKAHGDKWEDFIPTVTAAYIPNVMGGAGGNTKVASGGGDTTINQNGPITITAPSGDARAIARGLKHAITAQADSGPR